MKNDVHYEALCAKCGTSKRYVKSKKCVHCVNSRRHRYDTPEYKRITNRRRLYGITAEDLNARFHLQQGLCAICDVSLDILNGRRLFHVDHDHTTKIVRGILCGSCNNGLRCYRDDPALLRRAAIYLESHGKQ